MRIIVSGKDGDVAVTAEPFAIDSCSERFAVHQATEFDADSPFAWSATHVDTGFRVASGATAQQAIECARRLWASMPEEAHVAALTRARAIRASRRRQVVEGVLA